MLLTGGSKPAHLLVVQDGDSLIIGNEHVRMAGIDTPEHLDRHRYPPRWQEQPGAIEASQALTRIIGGRPGTCSGNKRGYYGRRLVTCTVDGVEINAEMVRQGWAWSDDRSGPYFHLEKEACKARRGIWGMTPPPVRPDFWRGGKTHKRYPYACKL